jgi:hypothetical protein
MTTTFSPASIFRSRLALILNLLGVAAPIFVSSAAPMGQDKFTAGSGKWSDGLNWSLGRVPTSSDNCILPMNSTVKSDTVTSDLGGVCANFEMG